ncbi:MAG: acetoin utilization protein AcuC [Alphaproteobacteria bacterium]
MPAPLDIADPLFIGSEIYRNSSYGKRHPLAIPRVSTTMDLCRALDWLPDSAYQDSPRADAAALTRFHDPAYVAALAEAGRTGTVSAGDRERFNLGRMENPIFPEMFSRPATAAGAGLHAAGLLVSAVKAGQGRRIYSPAGGTHHGRPGRASGFCYFNDPVLAILAMLDGGIERICYLDYDAHHGDGVEDAFADEPRVLTISVHEQGRWPNTGATPGWSQIAAGNVPVPPGFNDSELAFIIDKAIRPICTAFEPQIVVVQCGADALADDPLSKLNLSNVGLWHAVAASIDLAPAALVLGGGGYNPWSVARCWTGVWATLCGHEIPTHLPPKGEAVLRGLTWHRAAGRHPPQHWFDTLADRANRGNVRASVRAAVAAMLDPSEPWRSTP